MSGNFESAGRSATNLLDFFHRQFTGAYASKDSCMVFRHFLFMLLLGFGK
jgi:hypothetical protein